MEFPRLCPARLLSDQNFGSYMTHPHDYLFSFYDTNFYRPSNRFTESKSKENGSTVENEKGNYKITLDVQQFRPNEISVKVTGKEIIIEGHHEERADTHGFVTRQFKRRYPLPNHCGSENVTSTLSSDGVLTIIAAKTFDESEKIVPIKMCGVFPSRNYIQKEMIAETTQKNVANDIIENSNKTLSQGEHSHLLKSELLKDIEKSSEINGAKTNKKTSDTVDRSNLGATSSLLEESMKSCLGKANQKGLMSEMSGLAGKMGQKSSATEMSAMKSMSQKTEESSSYMSSSMSSSIKASGLSSELREATGNI